MDDTQVKSVFGALEHELAALGAKDPAKGVAIAEKILAIPQTPEGKKKVVGGVLALAGMMRLYRGMRGVQERADEAKREARVIDGEVVDDLGKR